MSHQPNILLFSAILGLIFILLDVYVLSRWTSHAKRRRFHPAWHRSFWIIALVMFGLYCYVNARRHFFRLDGADVPLFGLVTLWYLPKIGIAIVLLLRDLIRGIQKLKAHIWPSRSPIEVSSEHSGSRDVGRADRREFLTTAAWGVSVVPYLMVGRGMYSTLYDFQVVDIELRIRRLPRVFDGMRIAQISDIHAGSFPDHTPFQEVRYILSSRKPDAIAITGDFVNQKPSEMAVIAREFAKLDAPYGVFGSLGNHDHYNTEEEHQRLIDTLRGLGTKLLINQHHKITEAGESLVIAGTDNTGFRQSFARLDQALIGVYEDEPVILMAHDPTFWDREIIPKRRVDVTLSGHTHGGQLGVQALGFEFSPAQLIYKQWAGLYRNGEQQLYVNKGIGTVGPPLRIGVPPEITVFTLRAEGAGESMT